MYILLPESSRKKYQLRKYQLSHVCIGGISYALYIWLLISKLYKELYGWGEGEPLSLSLPHRDEVNSLRPAGGVGVVSGTKWIHFVPVGREGDNNSNRRYSIPGTEKASVASRDDNGDSDGASNSRNRQTTEKTTIATTQTTISDSMALPTAETPGTEWRHAAKQGCWPVYQLHGVDSIKKDNKNIRDINTTTKDTGGKL
jgi:hypothetical protein